MAAHVHLAGALTCRASQTEIRDDRKVSVLEREIALMAFDFRRRLVDEGETDEVALHE